jgi:hypothetical protein
MALTKSRLMLLPFVLLVVAAVFVLLSAVTPWIVASDDYQDSNNTFFIVSRSKYKGFIIKFLSDNNVKEKK